MWQRIDFKRRRAFGTMIPPDSSIDDEPALFTVNLNGKKIAKIRARPSHAHPQHNRCQHPSP